MQDLIVPTTGEIEYFLQEDVGGGDITNSVIPKTLQATASVITREDMVLCGQAWFNAVFKKLNPKIVINWLVAEGDYCVINTLLCELKGTAKDLLTGERTALNLLQTLSATASVSRQYSQAVVGTQCKILDTRKTIPGLRKAQKYAVTCGGCYNNRAGLYDGILIKENNIIAAGGVALAVSALRKVKSATIAIEVESLNEYQQALMTNPDRILLDNFLVQDIKTAVLLNNPGIELEASGNITLNNIREIAETGVDYISVGTLTKHIKAIDLSMNIKCLAN